MLSLVEPRWLKGTLLCIVSKDFFGKVETFWLIGTLTCDSDPSGPVNQVLVLFLMLEFARMTDVVRKRNHVL